MVDLKIEINVEKVELKLHLPDEISDADRQLYDRVLQDSARNSKRLKRLDARTPPSSEK